MNTRRDFEALDAADPLAPLRERFLLPEGVIYLDGNSLGACPKATPARLAEATQHEWATGLIRSWNTAGWIDLPQRIGDKIAPLIGAGAGEVIVGDSTSVNLYKALHAAAALAAAPGERVHKVVLSERSNFPTDLYIAESIAQAHNLELRLIEADEIDAHLDATTAILMLTHVHYRSGRMHDMAAVTGRAHAAGAVVVWDLAHSAGAVPVGLLDADADFAVDCGYKYLNGGPGAPAFIWAHPRHTARMDREQWRQPLSGWLGHAAPFEFSNAYRPAAGIQRFVCGTPPVLSMTALDCGLDVFGEVQRSFGGLASLREKSLALGDEFIARVEQRCAGHGLELASPRERAQRGSQVSFARAEGGYAIMQALIARGVIGDFRAGDPTAPRPTPDLLRFGFTPLYTRHVDVYDAVEQLAAVLESGEWREARFNARSAVT